MIVWAFGANWQLLNLDEFYENSIPWTIMIIIWNTIQLSWEKRLADRTKSLLSENIY